MKRLIPALLSCALLLTPGVRAYSRCNGQVVFSSDICADKRIALTFDDGPSGDNTQNILKILRKYGVKATFFVVGECAEQFPDLIDEIKAEGHEIGNHTYTHIPLNKMNVKKMCDEISRTEELLLSHGVKPSLFRPPEGKYNAELAEKTKEMGYRIVLWSVDTLDWTKAPADKIITRAGEPCGGSIILLHDLCNPPINTCCALEKLIPSLLSRGYTFYTVSELIA